MKYLLKIRLAIFFFITTIPVYAQIPSEKIAVHFRSDNGTSTTVDGEAISSWSDLNGSGFSAFQNTIGNEPLYYSNQVSGFPVLRFNGTTSSLTIPSPSDLGILGNSYEIYLVAKSNSSAIQFLIGGEVGNFEIHLNGGVGARVVAKTGGSYLDAGTDQMYVDNEIHLFHIQISDSGSSFWVDGNLLDTDNSDLRSSVSSDSMVIGKRMDGSFNFNGDIAEIILFNQLLSEVEKSYIDNYLKFRYQNPILATTPSVYLTAERGTSTQSNNSKISSWADQSVNNYSITQATESLQPVYIENAFNNYPGIRFSGSEYLRMGLPSEIGLQNSDYEFFVVAKSNSSASQYLVSASGAYFEAQLNGSTGFRYTPFSGTNLDFGDSGDFAGSNTHIFNFSGSSTGGSVRIDGMEGGSSASNLQINNDGTIWIGIRYNDVDAFSGDISDIIVYDRMLSESDRNLVETELINKYNITNMTTYVPDVAIDSVRAYQTGARVYGSLNPSGVPTQYYVKYGEYSTHMNDSSSVYKSISGTPTTVTIDIPNIPISNDAYFFKLIAKTAFQTNADSIWFSSHPLVYYVNSTSDAYTGTGNEGTLRYVLDQININASNEESLVVLKSITGTITVTSTLPPLNYPVKIIGPGADLLTISGNNLYQPFFIGSGLSPFSAENPAAPTVFMKKFAIKNGKHQGGGYVDSYTLYTGGGAGGFGGGLFINNGTVTLDSMLFDNNASKGGNGGAHGGAGHGFAGNGQDGQSSLGGPSGYLGGARGTVRSNGGPGAGGSTNSDQGIAATNGGFGAGGGATFYVYSAGGSGGFGGGGGSGYYGGPAGFGGGNGTSQSLGFPLASGGGGAFGGAVFIRNGQLSISNSTFTNNSLTKGLGYLGFFDGSEYGGAIASYEGYLELVNNTFSGNSGTDVYNHNNYVISNSDEPTVISSDFRVLNRTMNSVQLTFQPGNGAKRLIVIKAGSEPTFTPIDESIYAASTQFGFGDEPISTEYILYNDSDTTFTVTGLSQATTYHLKLFELNGGDPGFRSNYLVSSSFSAQFSTLSGIVPQESGSYLLFNGISSFVNVGQSSILEPANEITLEAWVYPTAQTAYAQIVGNMWDFATEGGGYSLALDGTSGIFFNIKTSSEIGNTFPNLSSGVNTLPLNQWSHVAASYDGTSRKIYINGIEIVSSNSISGNIIYPVSNAVRIGKYQDDNEDYFYEGGIEEVRIWKYARTQEQIRSDMHLSVASISDSMIGYWAINEATGTSTSDPIYGNNGTLSGFNFDASDGWRTNDSLLMNPGNATEFQSISTGTHAGNNLSLNFTEPTDSPVDVMFYNFNADPELIQEANYNYMSAFWMINPMQSPGSFESSITFTIPDSLSNAGAATADQYKLYTRSVNSLSAWTLLSTSASSVSGSTVTFSEITEFGQFALARSLEVNFQLDAGNALKFDGIDDYVTVPHNNLFNSDKITIELWLKWEASTNDAVQFLISKDLGVMEIHLGGSGFVRFIPTTYVYLDAPSESIPLNEWVHLTCLYDPGNSFGQIYINGQAVSTTNNGANPKSTPLVNTTTVLDIGRRRAEEYYYKGEIDELRIWNTIRTAQEIQTDMQRATPDGFYDSIVGYWQFNEANGTALEDYSNGLNGELFGFDNTASSGRVLSTIPINQIQTTLSGSQGWFMIANPISGLTFSEWLNPIWTQGFSDASSSTGSPNVLLWNTIDGTTNGSNWIEPSSANDEMMVGRGFILYAFNDDNGPAAGGNSGFPKTLISSGIQPLANQNLSSLLNTNIDGFALLGNPFAETIDWDLTEHTNLYESIYSWDPSISNWRVWNGTTGSLENGLIASNQAFFVETSAANPSLSIPLSAKTTQNNPSKINLNNESTSSKTPIIDLKISHDSGLSDQVFLQFSENDEPEQHLKAAVKQTPLSQNYVMLGAKGTQASVWSILPIAMKEGNLEVPLFLNSTIQGEFKLELDKTLFPEDWKVSLKDNLKSTITSLNEAVIINLTAMKKMSSAPKNGLTPTLTAVTTQDESRFSLLIDAKTTTSIEDDWIPATFELSTNYPNPFNPTTSIRYGVPESSTIKLEVFDILGKRVATLVNTTMKPGYYTVQFNAVRLSSGVYFYRLTDGKHYLTQKMTLLK